MRVFKLRSMAILFVLLTIFSPVLVSAGQEDQTVAEMAGGGQALMGLGLIGWLALGATTLIIVGGVAMTVAIPGGSGSVPHTPVVH